MKDCSFLRTEIAATNSFAFPTGRDSQARERAGGGTPPARGDAQDFVPRVKGARESEGGRGGGEGSEADAPMASQGWRRSWRFPIPGQVLASIALVSHKLKQVSFLQVCLVLAVSTGRVRHVLGRFYQVLPAGIVCDTSLPLDTVSANHASARQVLAKQVSTKTM